MPKHLLLASSIMCCLSGSMAAAQPAVSGADYKQWVGKYPSDRVQGKTFLDQPDVQRRVTQTLGRGALAEMKKMATSFRTQEYKGWLLASGCQPHMCVDAQWTVAIDLTSGETRTCLASLDADVVQLGASNKKPVRLPRKPGEGCPEGEKISEQFDRLFPAALR